jgi:VanZ family protein
MPIRINSFIPAILWFIFISVLFFLPGSELPDEDWFHKVYLDKWVHSGFFFLLVYLVCLPIILRSPSAIVWINQTVVAAICYGVVVEFIQKWWVPGRSFDVLDMLFDSIGALAAGWLGRRHMERVEKK